MNVVLPVQGDQHGGHVVQRVRGEAGQAVPGLLAGTGPGPVRGGRLLARVGPHNAHTLRPALQRGGFDGE